LAVQSSLLRADGNGSSAITDLRGFDLRGALNQGHSRQGPELPSSVNSANIACFQHRCKKSHRLRVSRDLAGHKYSGDVKKLRK